MRVHLFRRFQNRCALIFQIGLFATYHHYYISRRRRRLVAANHGQSQARRAWQDRDEWLVAVAAYTGRRAVAQIFTPVSSPQKALRRLEMQSGSFATTSSEWRESQLWFASVLGFSCTIPLSVPPSERTVT
jgi:hypothetical protein